MYLKSLILKGFKSFADRSVLSLQPGITAIVGPNGSGKSNISDAVLWVLGERSPSNLRGQAMEDIIFAGSAARKPVSVAEVELVLDNSDKTLSIDYDEVVVTRRMYRSGESEYLINGSPVRRLDVLDILHDTGLGTGTHSIISQGNLDSILQSKPEDRRALIEEAAGVLKHKQRKEKSARKLASMDVHLTRVRDVASEVERQLRPLERKAKKAEAYKEASGELDEIRLQLAVDDLRKLQVEWAELCEQESKLESEVDEHRKNVSAAEQSVSDIQELMKRESQDTSELSRRQRRAANLAERLDGAEMLLRERRRAAVASRAELRESIDGAAVLEQRARAELVTAEDQLSQAASAFERSQAQADELAALQESLSAELSALQQEAQAVVSQLATCEQEADGTRKVRDELQESLANGLAHVKLVETRRAELAGELERAAAEEANASNALKQAQETLAQLEAKEAAAAKENAERFTAKEQAQAALDEAREALRTAQADIAILEAAIRAHTEEDPALAWVMDNLSRFDADAVSLAASVRATSALEDLVEGLLGADLAALAVRDSQSALAIADALLKGDLPGEVALLPLGAMERKSAGDAHESSFGHALLDDLTYPEALAGAVEALLGDVVVCADREEALRAYEALPGRFRYAGLDGFVVWPEGKVRIFGKRKAEDDGVLARERRLEGARTACEARQKELDAAQEAHALAEEAYRKAQAASLAASQELASHRGVCSAAEAEHERTSTRLSTLAQEMEGIDAQLENARGSVDELRPRMEQAEARIAELMEQRAMLASKRDEQAAQTEPLQAKLSQQRDALAEAKLSAAKFEERKLYAERIAEARRRDIHQIAEKTASNKRQIVVKAAAVLRGEELLEVFELLARGIGRRSRMLDEALSASESAATSAHSNAAAARELARKAHDDYDAASVRMTDLQVRKSRMELQVETAVNVVVRDLGTPLEVAQELPPLEDRLQLEDERFRLERRIKNMGAINPDAAEEFAQLKERYDYLAGQLADMEEARRTLNRIVRMIDARMRDDFERTFNQVNANFQEVFSLLFPGGAAHLSLVDPDDIENTGVEVSAQPAGKRLTKMMLMSGGEKSLTALALLFAVYKIRSTPFYILDEVEAALDDTNLRRLTAYIETLRNDTQLIMITHQRRTMEMADVLFGVSMQVDGVTKVISQRLERALEQAEE